MNRINISLAVIVFPIISFSCNKIVSIQPPATQITSDNVFSSDQSATAAIEGLYVKFITSSSYDYFPTLLPALSADELVNYTTTSYYTTYQINNIATNDIGVANLWTFSYNIIYQANEFLFSIKSSNAVTTATKNQLTGEALFMRAFENFLLTNYFGDIPLLLTPDVTKTSIAAKTFSDGVYTQIIEDLNEATQLLQDAYQTPDRARVNRSTAMALLAKVYLFTNKWDSASNCATSIIDNPQYSINPNLMTVFQKSSAETIFQFATPNGYTDVGNVLIPGGAFPNFAFTQDFLNQIEAGDLRIGAWTGQILNSGITYYYPFKYKNRSANTSKPEYLIVFRLSEQYLIRAEALAHQNKLVQSLNDLNSVRSRAGLPFFVSNSQSDILTAIYKERRNELFSEWGNRWFDLKRTNEVNIVLSVLKPSTWKVTDSLYPIPVTEISANPNLTQNAGY